MWFSEVLHIELWEDYIIFLKWHFRFMVSLGSVSWSWIQLLQICGKFCNTVFVFSFFFKFLIKFWGLFLLEPT